MTKTLTLLSQSLSSMLFPSSKKFDGKKAIEGTLFTRRVRMGDQALKDDMANVGIDLSNALHKIGQREKCHETQIEG